MKLKHFLLAAFLIALTVVIWRRNYFSNNNISGTYINNNYNSILEGPSSIKRSGIDTLTINPDGTFKNSSWGEGNYVIRGSNIHFSYAYELDKKAGYQTSLSRTAIIGKPIIILNYDLNFYYERID